MSKTYSTYEAKARLSELLKRVTKGDVVTSVVKVGTVISVAS